jgi:hypothetical protein
MDIKENTVSAVNQMINSSEVSFLGDRNAKTRILVLGNSITRHGPCKDIGWERDWGMAASAPEKDYVHRLYAKLTEDGQDVYMRIRQASYWETHFCDVDILQKYEEDRAFDADIVIFRLGDNAINAKEEDKQHFETALESFIEYIAPNAKKIIYMTCFWSLPEVDQTIQRVAQKRDEICIDGWLAHDDTNLALGLFEHAGVAGHPGDKGMEVIAERIFSVLKR